MQIYEKYFWEQFSARISVLFSHSFRYILIINDNDVVLQKKKKKRRDSMH